MEYATSFYLTLGFSLLSGIIGYYIGERGWKGVENDLHNVKQDVTNLKNRLDGTSSTTTTSVTPTGVVSNTVTAATDNGVATH